MLLDDRVGGRESKAVTGEAHARGAVNVLGRVERLKAPQLLLVRHADAVVGNVESYVDTRRKLRVHLAGAQPNFCGRERHDSLHIGAHGLFGISQKRRYDLLDL